MTAPPAARRRKHWKWIVLATVILVPVLIISAWITIALSYSYSAGERAGYVQKLSKKGWVCKTWEGELAITNFPGVAPQIFAFSVRNDSIAALIEQNMGRRVSLTYEQHPGLPTKCFGETEYFITNVRITQP